MSSVHDGEVFFRFPGAQGVATAAGRGAGRGGRRLAGLAVLLAVVGLSGCCCFDRLYCPSDCAMGWDPLLDSSDGGCGECGSCGGCGAGTIGQATKFNLTCGSGCGDVYWGEWLSNPPDDCDPCDNWGGFVGPRCCPPRFWDCLCSGFCGLWGGRHGGYGHECSSCGSAGAGCASCGGHDEMMMGDEVVHDGELMPQGTPVPAPRPQQPTPKAAPQPQPAPDAQTRRAVPYRQPGRAVAAPRGRSQAARPATGTKETKAMRKRAT